MVDRTTRPVLAVLLTAALALGSAGCGARPSTGSATGASGRPGDRQDSCASVPPAAEAPRTLTQADTGSTVCLAAGERLEVYLQGSADQPWTPIVLTGTGLSVAPSGKRALAVGVTGGFYAAGPAGTARLTSTRPCPGTATARPTACNSTTFTVDVVVH